jgi:hypothetical protein
MSKKEKSIYFQGFEFSKINDIMDFNRFTQLNEMYKVEKKKCEVFDKNYDYFTKTKTSELFLFNN